MSSFFPEVPLYNYHRAYAKEEKYGGACINENGK